MTAARPPLTELNAMLAQLAPRQMPGNYVYVCLPHVQADQHGPAQALATFREAEGVTLIVEQAYAEQQGWPISFECAWIQLDVYSALHAVGLSAAIATRLAAHGISCNLVAAYHHDHLFVPRDQVSQALQALQGLADDGTRSAPTSG